MGCGRKPEPSSEEQYCGRSTGVDTSAPEAVPGRGRVPGRAWPAREAAPPDRLLGRACGARVRPEIHARCARGAPRQNRRVRPRSL